MDISGISKNLNNYTVTEAKNKFEQSEFEKILKGNMASGEDEKLKEACEQFEAYYLRKLFTQMRQTVPKADLLEAAPGRDVYEDMLYDGYADEISEGSGVGIAEMMYKQLKKDI